MELQRHARARNGRADSARHARLILLLADGLTWGTIHAKLDTTDRYLRRWSQRVTAIGWRRCSPAMPGVTDRLP